MNETARDSVDIGSLPQQTLYISMSDLRRRSTTTSSWRVSSNCKHEENNKSGTRISHSLCRLRFRQSFVSRHREREPCHSQVIAAWCAYIQGESRQCQTVLTSAIWSKSI